MDEGRPERESRSGVCSRRVWGSTRYEMALKPCRLAVALGAAREQRRPEGGR
jgi:hypothetical protein